MTEVEKVIMVESERIKKVKDGKRKKSFVHGNVRLNSFEKQNVKSFNWLFFYGISTFIGYLMPNPFLFK